MNPKGRLLVVDDDLAIQRIVDRAATSAGFEVSQALDGEAALEAVERLRPDIILLDIMMPRLDGRDVLTRLKGDPSTRDIPVIIFSAKRDHSDRLLGLELGADDYIEKPFSVEMLLRRLEDRVSKSRHRGESPP